MNATRSALLRTVPTFTRRTLLAGGLGLFAGTCSSAMEPLPADVGLVVDMKEYVITLDRATLRAGVVKIGIRNLGRMVHDFDLYRTELPADKLPVDGGSAKVKMEGLVRQMMNIAPNRSATLSVELSPGNHVVICNIAGHYQLGMRIGLRVDPS